MAQVDEAQTQHRWHSPFANTVATPVARSGHGSDLPANEVRRIAPSLHLLSLFGGPDKTAGLDKRVLWWGAKITVFDLDISPSHDLVDEGFWSYIRQDLTDGMYDGVGASAPCSTFSGGRRNDGGPRPLRGPEPPDIYGFKRLTPKEKEQVRIGTCCAFRGIEACDLMVSQNKCFWSETPRQ